MCVQICAYLHFLSKFLRVFANLMIFYPSTAFEARTASLHHSDLVFGKSKELASNHPQISEIRNYKARKVVMSSVITRQEDQYMSCFIFAGCIITM